MTLGTQFYTLLSMIAMGGIFGASLDTYSRFLQRTKRKSWLVFINDILFWTSQGLSIFYTLFLVNQGELRFYIFIALLCGFAAYQSLIKNIYLKGLEIFISASISTYQFLVKMANFFIYQPVKWIITIIISTIIFIAQGLFTLVKYIYQVLLSILKLILKPFAWVVKLIWKFMPKNIKNIVGKLYNIFKGYYKKIKNYVSIQIKRFKKPKE